MPVRKSVKRRSKKQLIVRVVKPHGTVFPLSRSDAR
ncbi:hypothetical protein BH18ACI5_BH18ACI5_19540 [soil metagenome]